MVVRCFFLQSYVGKTPERCDNAILWIMFAFRRLFVYISSKKAKTETTFSEGKRASNSHKPHCKARSTKSDNLFVHVKTANWLQKGLIFGPSSPLNTGCGNGNLPIDLFSPTKIVTVLTFLFTGGKKSWLFIYLCGLKYQWIMTRNSSLLQNILIAIAAIIALTFCFVLVLWILNWIFDATSNFDSRTILQGFVFSIIYLPIQYWLSKRVQKKK